MKLTKLLNSNKLIKNSNTCRRRRIRPAGCCSRVEKPWAGKWRRPSRSSSGRSHLRLATTHYGKRPATNGCFPVGQRLYSSIALMLSALSSSILEEEEKEYHEKRMKRLAGASPSTARATFPPSLIRNYTNKGTYSSFSFYVILQYAVFLFFHFPTLPLSFVMWCTRLLLQRNEKSIDFV